MDEKKINFLQGLEEYCEYKGELEMKEKIHQLVNILRSDDIEKALIHNFFKTTYHGPNLNHMRSIHNYYKKNTNDDIINDAFSRGQLRSKVWLANELKNINNKFDNIVLLAGWMGQLVDIVSRSIQFNKLRNIEIDRDCCIESDYNFNIDNLKDWRVKSVNADINNLQAHHNGYELNIDNFKSDKVITEKFLPDLVINTSAEHMSTEWYEQLRSKDWDCIVAIQSNNLFDHPDHVNCVYSDSHMMKKYPMREVLYHGELFLQNYKRVMIIGKP
jgi:hypothetical protein